MAADAAPCVLGCSHLACAYPSPYQAQEMVAAAIEDRNESEAENDRLRAEVERLKAWLESEELRADRLKAALAEERERADVMAPVARMSHGKTECPDPPACYLWLALQAHDAAREAAR